LRSGSGSGSGVEELLRRADSAMYLAKDTDEGVHVHAGGDAVEHDRQPSRDDLRSALAAGDLAVHLLPRMSLVDGRTVAVEALLRWEHPTHGMLDAHDLLPVADRAGLRGRLTESVLDLALAGAARWWTHRGPLPVAVELSPASLSDLDLPAKVAAALSRHGLPARALTVEVVEQSLLGASERARRIVAELRALGVTVALDHYGTGHGTLAALRHLPVDELILDPALVADVAIDARAASVVRHTAALAHALDLRVVAAGVADTATLGALAGLGCDAVAGPVVAGAMPADALLRWLRDRPADRAAVTPTAPRTAGTLAALAR
jgi:EAL domain-containing protein (putative c-di-GMP-specific phosphodiesterase class I)